MGSIDWLEQLLELREAFYFILFYFILFYFREAFYLLDHLLTIKGITQEQPDGREAKGKGKGGELPHSPGLFTCSPTGKLFKPPPFGFLWGLPLHRHS